MHVISCCLRFRCVSSPVEIVAKLQHAQLRRPFYSGEGLVEALLEYDLLHGGRKLHFGGWSIEPVQEQRVLALEEAPRKIRVNFALMLFLLISLFRALPAPCIIHEVPAAAKEAEEGSAH